MVKKSKKYGKKRLVRLSAALLASLAALPAARAQTLSCNRSLVFGDFVTCGVTDTVTITPSGGRSVAGCVNAGPAPFNPAQCNVNVPSLPQQLVVSITSTAYEISNGTAKMDVNNFQCKYQGSNGSVTGNCPHTTTGNFLLMDIGADLVVGNPQPSGTYSGTFTVNVNFN